MRPAGEFLLRDLFRELAAAAGRSTPEALAIRLLVLREGALATGPLPLDTLAATTALARALIRADAPHRRRADPSSTHDRGTPTKESMSMKILFGATPFTGHLLPLLPLADAAADAGHDVAFLTAASMERFLRTRRLLPAGPEFGELVTAVVEHAGPGASPAQFGPAAAEMFAGTRVDMAWDDSLGQALGFAPDLLVGEWADFVTPLLAARLDVPWAAHSVGGPLPAIFDDPMRELAARQHTRRSLTPRNRLALLDLWPDSLRLPTDTAPERDRLTIRTSGVPVSLPGQPSRPVPPREPGRARVLLTMGTTADDPGLVAALAASIAETDADVLVTAGPDHLPSHPRVHALGFTPLAELLPDVDVVVGSGGSGTLLASLGAGVPSVLFPVVADQPLNAERAAHRGAARVLTEPDAAGKAVTQVLGDPSYRDAAQALAAELSTLQAPGKALTELLSRRG